MFFTTIAEFKKAVEMGEVKLEVTTPKGKKNPKHFAQHKTDLGARSVVQILRRGNANTRVRIDILDPDGHDQLVPNSQLSDFWNLENDARVLRDNADELNELAALAKS